ncbi:tryptophan repeat gene family protein [Bacillus phage vB_BpuM-BpSp]|nr:tryptophan repeat gene family protein [Bacillus phage vB_BpuM-BpSp]
MSIKMKSKQERFLDYMNFRVFKNQSELEERIEKKGKRSVNWDSVSSDSKLFLSESFIEEYIDDLNMIKISKNQTLSKDFIDKYKHKMNIFALNNLVMYQKVSEDFLRSYAFSLNWEYVSECQKLSETFIEEFHDLVDWCRIGENQKLSEEFLIKHMSRLSLKDLEENPNITLSEKIKILFKISEV